jgi:hypothetical protein
MDTTVIPPLYYNEMHQFKKVFDIFCMGGGSEVYSGRELIDNHTKIEMMDINFWDTMRLKFFGSFNNIDVESYHTLATASLFHSDFSNFIGENCTFIYDSDGKGINEPGINIIGGSIPLKSFYVPSHIPTNVRTTYSLFESTCHDLEQQFGHIKVYCAPNKVGDKLKIKFKDYALPPAEFAPLGGQTPEGQSSSIDSGFYVERNIEEVIDAIQESYDASTAFY